jgi:chromosome segregation ATPase
MKNLTLKRMLSALAVITILTLTAGAQAPSAADRKAAEIKRLETSLNAAKAKVEQNQRKIETADSLINAGEALLDESRTEDKAISAERKSVEKEYKAARKPVYKNTTSKDKEVATAAKAELKELDTKYKADIKALDTRYKESTKKFTTGNSNISKGTTNKKNAKDALNQSEAALKTAQEKYDAATAPPDEGKKKK